MGCRNVSAETCPRNCSKFDAHLDAGLRRGRYNPGDNKSDWAVSERGVGVNTNVTRGLYLGRIVVIQNFTELLRQRVPPLEGSQ